MATNYIQLIKYSQSSFCNPLCNNVVLSDNTHCVDITDPDGPLTKDIEDITIVRTVQLPFAEFELDSTQTKASRVIGWTWVWAVIDTSNRVWTRNECDDV